MFSRLFFLSFLVFLALPSQANQYPPDSPTYFCSRGFVYDSESKLCIEPLDGAYTPEKDTLRKAVGPMTDAMTEKCQEIESEAACQNYNSQKKWPHQLASWARGSDICMRGAEHSEEGFCVEGDFIYGPFDELLVRRCKALSKDYCESMKWPEHDLEQIKNATPVAPEIVTPPDQTPPVEPEEEDVETKQKEETRTFCLAPWNPKEKNADYTFINWYSSSKPLDKKKHKITLQGSGFLKEKFCKASEGVQCMCQNAKRLLPCFDISVQKDEAENPYLKKWTQNRNIDLRRLKLALAFQETRLGRLHDQCWKKTCNGIGLMQVIHAIRPDGKVLSEKDEDWEEQWRGITFNVLTNLEYSSRLLNAIAPSVQIKSKNPSDHIYSLASTYNNNPNLGVRRHYASSVTKYYKKLEKYCKL